MMERRESETGSSESIIPFSVYLKREMVIIPKIFKFTKVSGKPVRFAIPKEAVESLKINQNTNFVVAFSEAQGSVLIPFFNFEELLKPEESEVAKQREILLSIRMDGYLLSGVRKVWSSKSVKEVQYGITMPAVVARKLNINEYTLFIMGYLVSKRALYLEFRSLWDTVMMEHLPVEKEMEEASIG